nr:hypothetical protein [Gilliamella bombicola]
MTKQENIVEMSTLEFCIREDLNENAPCAYATEEKRMHNRTVDLRDS